MESPHFLRLRAAEHLEGLDADRQGISGRYRNRIIAVVTIPRTHNGGVHHGLVRDVGIDGGGAEGAWGQGGGGVSGPVAEVG